MLIIFTFYFWKVGFSLFFHYIAYFNLITNVGMSEWLAGHETIMDPKKNLRYSVKLFVFYGFNLKTSSVFYPF
jgi:hypothetical protein